MIVDIQFSPGNTNWPTLRSAAREAEARGYGAVFALDHLAGVQCGGASMIETFTLLGALAEATTTIELGTMTVNVYNRQIGTLVSSIASVASVSGRQVLFGLGAGSAPGTTWAEEHDAVGADLEPDVAVRHARVRAAIDLARHQWRDDRDERFATFPLPRPTPTIIVGANSVALSRLAGECADGVNVQWRHPRRAEFVDAYEAVVGDRPFLRTTYTTFQPELLDPDDAERIAMREQGFDRLVLAVWDDLADWLALEGRVNV